MHYTGNDVVVSTIFQRECRQGGGRCGWRVWPHPQVGGKDETGSSMGPRCDSGARNRTQPPQLSTERGGQWQNAREILYYLSRSKKRITGPLHLLVFPHGRITEANILLEHHDIVSSHTATSCISDKPLVYDHLLLQRVETTGSRGEKRVRVD